MCIPRNDPSQMSGEVGYLEFVNFIFPPEQARSAFKGNRLQNP